MLSFSAHYGSALKIDSGGVVPEDVAFFVIAKIHNRYIHILAHAVHR